MSKAIRGVLKVAVGTLLFTSFFFESCKSYHSTAYLLPERTKKRHANFAVNPTTVKSLIPTYVYLINAETKTSVTFKIGSDLKNLKEYTLKPGEQLMDNFGEVPILRIPIYQSTKVIQASPKPGHAYELFYWDKYEHWDIQPTNKTRE